MGPEEDVRSLGVGITGGSKLPDRGSGNQTGLLQQLSCAPCLGELSWRTKKSEQSLEKSNKTEMNVMWSPQQRRGELGKQRCGRRWGQGHMGQRTTVEWLSLLQVKLKDVRILTSGKYNLKLIVSMLSLPLKTTKRDH